MLRGRTHSARANGNRCLPHLGSVRGQRGAFWNPFFRLYRKNQKKIKKSKRFSSLSTLARLNQRIWILIFWARFLLFSIYLPNLSDEEICLASVLMVLTCWQSSEGQSQQWILSCQLDWVNESLLCFPNCNCNLDNGRAESCGERSARHTQLYQVIHQPPHYRLQQLFPSFLPLPVSLQFL